MEVNKTLSYQGISYKIVSFDRKDEVNGKSAPSGKEFLVFNLEAKNTQSRQIIIFYDEEARLITDAGVVSPFTYKIENNFDAGAETSGFFAFVVSKGIKNFTFQFAKKVGPKVELVFKLPEK